MFLLSANQMREIDARAVSMGIASEVLMENAATATVYEILKQNPEKVIIFTGKGQNAGDGFAIARRLYVKNINVEVITLAPEASLTGAAALNFGALKRLGVTIREFSKDIDLSCCVIVDCIFGTGIKGRVEGTFKEAVEAINSSTAYVISADIPSGISADTGEVLGCAVRADKTITYGFLKAGLFSPLSADYVGEIVLDDVSIPENADILSDVKTFLITENDVYFPKSSKAAHKGSNGKVIIAGGSEGMCGAVFMAADSAAKVGAGLVTCGTKKSLLPVFMSKLYTGMCTDIEKVDFSAYDTVLIGNGMGSDEKNLTILEKAIRETEKNLIIDADGLNLLSKNISLLKEKKCNIFLTPHPLEFSRLCSTPTDEVLKNRVNLAKEFSKEYGVYLILKSSHTVVALPDGNAYINSTGNEGMAKGGSGDVLAGMLAGMVHKYPSPEVAAVSAVYLHSLAGDIAAENIGKTSMTAKDIIDSIPDAINFIN